MSGRCLARALALRQFCERLEERNPVEHHRNPDIEPKQMQFRPEMVWDDLSQDQTIQFFFSGCENLLVLSCGYSG